MISDKINVYINLLKSIHSLIFKYFYEAIHISFNLWINARNLNFHLLLQDIKFFTCLAGQQIFLTNIHLNNPHEICVLLTIEAEIF